MKYTFYLLLLSFTLLSFCQFEGRFKYLDSSGKEYYSLTRTKISKNVFVDTKTIPLGNNLPPAISTDTFYIKNKNWYIKEFGKYHLFLGPESFRKDSLFIQLDIAAKRSDLGFWNDSQTIYPSSYIYRPVKIIRIENDKSVYVYNSIYYIYGQEADFSSPETIYFDPEVGIVKMYSLTIGEVILKDYPYLDSLKLE